MSDCLRKYQMAQEFDKAIAAEQLKIKEEALETFLKENPHMKPYQSEIEGMLSRSGDNRLVVLSVLMAAKLIELERAWHDLHDICKRLP